MTCEGGPARRLTTHSPDAAAAYREAAAAVCGGTPCVPSLLRAVRHDPALIVAVAAHAVLRSLPMPATPCGWVPQRWERHHVEILRAVADGAGARADALLRDHLDEHGCDPVLLAAYAARAGADELAALDELRSRVCSCPTSTVGLAYPRSH